MSHPQPMTSQERPAQYVLRFTDPNMRKEIKVQAALNQRSMNAELNYLIKCGQAWVARVNQGIAA